MNAKVGRYADGGGLYLQVVQLAGGDLGRSWFFRYAAPTGTMTKVSAAGREYRFERQMGLGPVHTISLAKAREAARACRELLLQGVDPLAAKGAQRAALRLESAKDIKFSECAAKFIASRDSTWRNAEHRRQWQNTLLTYANPAIGTLPVAAVDTTLVMRILEPLWYRAPETASRLRGRIEMILDWATVAGFRTGDNPARWRGHLEHLLPSRRKLQKVEHHTAIPYREMPDLMAKLRAEVGGVARALEFIILTATRVGEVTGACWDEINLGERVWTIPGNRMKAGVEHRVPLSPRAIEILNTMHTSGPVFPALRGGVMSSNRPRALLQRLSSAGATVHGLRSSFRDWAGEQTSFPREVCEQALAHMVGNAVENAYRRGDLLEKRRQLMDAWAEFCSGGLCHDSR
jgi:integrase